MAFRGVFPVAYKIIATDFKLEVFPGGHVHCLFDAFQVSVYGIDVVVLDEPEEAFRVHMVVGWVKGINKLPVEVKKMRCYVKCLEDVFHLRGGCTFVFKLFFCCVVGSGFLKVSLACVS